MKKINVIQICIIKNQWVHEEKDKIRKTEQFFPLILFDDPECTVIQYFSSWGNLLKRSFSKNGVE